MINNKNKKNEPGLIACHGAKSSKPLYSVSSQDYRHQISNKDSTYYSFSRSLPKYPQLIREKSLPCQAKACTCNSIISCGNFVGSGFIKQAQIIATSGFGVSGSRVSLSTQVTNRNGMGIHLHSSPFIALNYFRRSLKKAAYSTICSAATATLGKPFVANNCSLLTFLPDSRSLLQDHVIERFIFNNPRAERALIRKITKNKKGVYIWIGKDLSNQIDLAAAPAGFPLRNAFISENHEVYVGCSYTDSYARITRYYQKQIERNRPVHRYISESGGIDDFVLVFFLIGEDLPVSEEMVAELEYYFMGKLNPSLNVNLTSLVPSKHNVGRRVFVYNKSKKKLLYRFKSWSALARSACTKLDTIRKHIKLGTLLLGAFYVSSEPLPGVSDTPFCTEQSFIELAKKTRLDHIAKPGGLYGKDKCKKVYVYDGDQTVLLRVFPSKGYLEKVAKVSHISVNKFIKSGAKFLNSFIITNQPLPNISQKSAYSEAAFVEMVKKARNDSRGCKVLAENISDPSLSETFITRILLAKHFEISISTVGLYLKTGQVFRDEWRFVRLQKR